MTGVRKDILALVSRYRMAATNTRILVVDGSAVSRAILTRILRDELQETTVIPCASGREAVELLGTEQFDLVTTSLLLPDMDGLDLSRAVRRMEPHHYTPVIVVSGDADMRLLREGFEAGVTDYFDKSQGYKAFGGFIKAFVQRNSGLVGRILYVEDSRTTAAVVMRMLEKHGLQVEHTPTAEQALELLGDCGETPETRFDMVVTDFYLKGSLTGGDLLHGIRAKHHFSQQELPVLVLTGNDDEQRQVEVFHAGANDFVNKPIIEEVLLARVRSLLLVKHQYDALKQQAEAMRWLAATDSLTGVRSKRYLLDNGEEFLRRPEHQPAWAMLIDIDHFKQINDKLGHITGDHVLAALGETLNASFPDGMVVRFGGEEFCVLIRSAGRALALERAERLRADIAALEPADVPVTISLGLAGVADHPDVPFTRLLSLADKALYDAKENGRNRVSIYAPEGPRAARGAA